MKWVLGSPGDLVVKSKLSLGSGSKNFIKSPYIFLIAPYKLSEIFCSLFIDLYISKLFLQKQVWPPIIQCLKKILLVPVNWSLWHNPGGQATYHDGHKIAFSLWPKWIRTGECGILMIKKNFCEKFTNHIIFSLFNVLVSFDCERKITFFYLHFSSIPTLKKPV